MASSTPQNLQNHARYVPLYHFVLFAILVANLVYAVIRLWHFDVHSLFQFLVAVALVLITWFARAFALTVQDRVIRLELRLRLQSLAPDLTARFDQLAVGQMTALRFAGDDELPALTRDVLDGKLVGSADIKKRVQHWRADHLRA